MALGVLLGAPHRCFIPGVRHLIPRTDPDRSSGPSRAWHRIAQTLGIPRSVKAWTPPMRSASLSFVVRRGRVSDVVGLHSTRRHRWLAEGATRSVCRCAKAQRQRQLAIRRRPHAQSRSADAHHAIGQAAEEPAMQSTDAGLRRSPRVRCGVARARARCANARRAAQRSPARVTPQPRTPPLRRRVASQGVVRLRRPPRWQWSLIATRVRARPPVGERSCAVVAAQRPPVTKRTGCVRR